MSVKWDQDENIETSEKPSTVFLYSRGCDDDPIDVTFSIFIRLSWFPAFHASSPESFSPVHVLQPPQFSCKRLVARLNVEEL